MGEVVGIESENSDRYRVDNYFFCTVSSLRGLNLRQVIILCIFHLA